MFSMSDKQKQTYDHLMEAFKNAESIEESRYYFAEIQLYLDDLQSINKSSLQEARLQEYHQLKKQLLESTTKREVLFYEERIHECLSKTNDSKLP